MNKYVYGVDVGGTHIKIGLFQIKPFKKISDKEVKTPTGDDSNLIFDKIVETIERLNEESKVDMLTKLVGVLSEETILSELPYVQNVDEEIERLEKERNFGFDVDE